MISTLRNSLLAVIATMAMASPVLAETVVIGGGDLALGSGYAKKAVSIVEKLTTRLPDGYEVSRAEMAGSNALTIAACLEKIQATPTQIDAIFQRQKEGCVLLPVAKYGGDGEIAVLLVPPKAQDDIGDLGDLNSSFTVAIGEVDSGAELTWKTMVGIEQGEEGSGSAWSEAQTVNASILDLDVSASFGTLSAAFLVLNENHQTIRNLLDLGWKPVDMKDKDINDQQFKGAPLYEQVRYTVTDNGGRKWKKVRGYRVASFIVVSPKVQSDKNLLRAIQTAAR